MSLPQTLRAMLATIIGEEFPGLALAGPWTYRVTKVTVADGVRCNIEPVEGNRQQAHDNVDQWPGVGGAVVTPQVGAECLVEFRDGSKDRPVIVAFKPLRITGGTPTKIEAYSDEVKLGDSAAQALALAASVASNLTAIASRLTAIGTLLNVPGPVSGATGTVVPFVPSSVATTKVKGS
jgi:hypothetical protein